MIFWGRLFIYLTNKRTFVHCTAGIGRAPQTVISYLIFFKGYTLDDAINLVKAKRPITYINRGNSISW